MLRCAVKIRLQKYTFFHLKQHVLAEIVSSFFAELVDWEILRVFIPPPFVNDGVVIPSLYLRQQTKKMTGNPAPPLAARRSDVRSLSDSYQ